MPQTRVFPLTALLATMSALLVVASVRKIDTLAAFGVMLAAGLLVSQGREGKLARRLIAWTIPLAVPVILIHTFLNGEFAVDGRLLELLPVRSAGFAFGSLVAIRMMILSVAGGYWLCVGRDDLVESLLRRNIPSVAILFLVQSVGIAKVVSRRIDSVYLAQRARGIPVGASFVERLRSFPSVLLPVIVGTFVEAEGRIPALVSQGYGSLYILPSPAPRLTAREVVLLSFPPLIAAVAVASERLW